MSKIGVSIKIDVTKIDKTRLFQGQKGIYMDLTTFIDLDNVDQYGNHGFISQTVNKEEKGNGVTTPILGNSKIFWKEQTQQPLQNNQQQPMDAQAPQFNNINDDIPF